ncbi:symmetrical bis(5'-nucleosyl)-tetraphosphatase [Catenovulum sp. 2E275]|uniref:symmetrical bis(5'-nucleosyl)-tetraphosphatase n=1 Tax=Catenovulum sp. 2E275 TaxID=2980497 RepID=UPI0021CFC8BA|nr:symmetrical bis(5'-nucleosyl)-tetraphosphatase [Catenovulum sp. 2E275]MCU4675085.1 symmetrical bis(5'-nucleosyl)-tetraphosphatase [Catenovulum sp. 2E275]
MAHYFVGDIQGCYDELMRLLDKVKFDPKQDILCPVGDLVARGPASEKVAKLMLELDSAVEPVLGNHDLHLLSIYAGFFEPKKNDKLKKLLNASYLEKYAKWLRKQPLIRQYPQFDIVMSHAGMHPSLPVSEQLVLAAHAEQKINSKDYKIWLERMYGNEPRKWRAHLTEEEAFRFIINTTTRMRYIDAEGGLDFKCKLPPEQAPLDLSPWFDVETYNPQTFVFGHWAALLGHTRNSQFIGLDTGCVWGNHLTLYKAETREFFIQQSLS